MSEDTEARHICYPGAPAKVWRECPACALEAADTELAPATIPERGEKKVKPDPVLAEAAAALASRVHRIANSILMFRVSEIPQYDWLVKILQEESDAAIAAAAVVESIVGPRSHILKTDPGPFADVKSGKKTYEVRKFDRDFQVGDRLRLFEFDRETGKYSGEQLNVRVVHVLKPGSYGLPADVGVMGIELEEHQVSA